MTEVWMHKETGELCLVTLLMAYQRYAVETEHNMFFCPLDTNPEWIEYVGEF